MINSIKARFLLVFILISTVPIVLVSFGIGIKMFSVIEKDGQKRLHAISGQIGTEIESFFEKVEHDVRVVDSVVGIGEAPIERQRELLGSLMLSDNVYQEITLQDNTGNPLVRVSRAQMSTGYEVPDIKDEKLFTQEIVSSGKVAYGFPRFDKKLREPLISLYYPILNPATGKVESVLDVTIRFKTIWNAIARMHDQTGMEIFVTDLSGLVAAHRNPTVVLSGQRLNLPEADGRRINEAGEEVLASTQTIALGNTKLVVLVESPLRVALATAWSSVVINSVIGGVTLLAAVFISLFLSQKFIAPLSSLAKASKELGEGKFPAPLVLTGGKELTQLGVEFNESVERLKTLREALEKSNQDLERRVHVRTQRLALANKELESFAYSVSHDLRAPLRAMDGFGQALDEDYADQLDDTARDYISRIRNAGLRMGTMIDALLSLSRLTRDEVHRSNVDITALAQETVETLRSGQPERDVKVQIASDMSVNGDRKLLIPLIDNLVGNAWKYTSMRENAEIEIGVEEENGEKVFFVRDNGVGFNMEYYSQLFGVFNRLHRNDEFGGQGIGLATAQRIIIKHGGRIWAEGKEGEGAVFYFNI